MSDESKSAYKIEDDKARARVEAFASSGVPDTDLGSDLVQARVLCEAAINSSQTSVAVCLLGVISKLAKEKFKRDLVQHSLLTRPAVFAFAQELIRIVGEEVSELDGFEDALLRVSERVDEAMDRTLRNDDKSIACLAIPK